MQISGGWNPRGVHASVVIREAIHKRGLPIFYFLEVLVQLTALACFVVPAGKFTLAHI